MKKLFKHTNFSPWTPWLTDSDGTYIGTAEANELNYYYLKLYEQTSSDCRHRHATNVLEDETLHWQLIQKADYCYNEIISYSGQGEYTTETLLRTLCLYTGDNVDFARIILEAWICRELVTLVDLLQLVEEPRDEQESFTIKWKFK